MSERMSDEEFRRARSAYSVEAVVAVAAEASRAREAEARLTEDVWRLRDTVEKMRGALSPFARAWNEQEPDDDGADVDAMEMHVRPSDCRRAAEVLGD